MTAPNYHNQPYGDQLQAIPKHKLVESGLDYADIFRELQIKPEHYDDIVRGVLRQIRAKRMKSLKSATHAMIKNLSYAFLRGFGKILYRTQADKWLVDEEQLRLAGKERLQFTQGDCGVDGPNAHFYTILEPMWWIMRDILFELKPATKRQGKPREKVEDGDVWQDDTDMQMEERLRGESGALSPWIRECPPEAANEEALNATEAQNATEENAPPLRFEHKQQHILNHVEQEMNLTRRNGCWQPDYAMTATETDEAVQGLIAWLHEIRCRSEPDAFARSWETNLGRLAEIENFDDLKTGKLVGSKPGQDQVQDPDQNIEDIRGGSQKSLLMPNTQQKMRGLNSEDTAHSAALTMQNHASEPFNTNGPLLLCNRLPFGQTPLVPSTISAYITTSPALHPYKSKSYHWLNAPIGIADCKRLFNGIDQRVGVHNIQRYALSYGWTDVMRMIENHEEGKRHGFSVLRHDIANAAQCGVTTWRLKILVAGEAPVYQRIV